MIIVDLICASLAAAATGVAVYHATIVRALAEAVNCERAQDRANLAVVRKGLGALEARHDALHADIADWRAGLAGPAPVKKPVKKAAPRKAPARKKA